MNKPVNSTRRAFSLSTMAMLGWGGAVATLPRDAMAQAQAQAPVDLDSRVKAFLDQRRNTWSQGVNYWNVRYEDGQALHDLVLKNGFKRLLEVGTSTGHSAIWLGWAAAKTGGRLTTIEIEPTRILPVHHGHARLGRRSGDPATRRDGAGTGADGS